MIKQVFDARDKIARSHAMNKFRTHDLSIESNRFKISEDVLLDVSENATSVFWRVEYTTRSGVMFGWRLLSVQLVGFSTFNHDSKDRFERFCLRESHLARNILEISILLRRLPVAVWNKVIDGDENELVNWKKILNPWMDQTSSEDRKVVNGVWARLNNISIVSVHEGVIKIILAFRIELKFLNLFTAFDNIKTSF